MSAGEKKPGKQKVNLEAVEAKPAVRVFLLQPIDSSQINDLTDWTSLHLTEVALVKKSEKANNPGDLSPLGGKVLPGESLEDAAERHALEKTHLIFANLEQLEPVQTYSFDHRGTLEKREVTTFVGRLYSRKFDEPYPLDENANMEGFVSVNRKQLKELIDGRKVRGKKMYDALNKTKVQRKSSNIGPDKDQIVNMQDILSETLMWEEVKRKMSVLNILVSGRFGNETSKGISEDLKKLEQDLKESKSDAITYYKKVNKFWAANIHTLVSKPAELRIALEFANTQDILNDLEKYQKKPGDTIPTIHMMFPVMFGLNFDLRFLDLFKREPHLEKIYAMSRILFLYNNMKTGERGAASERLLRRILDKKEGEIGERELVVFFQQKGILPTGFKADFSELGKDVDSFFEVLQAQSKISPELASLSHVNEVEGESFDVVAGYAFQKSGESSHKDKVKFEAQRKLLLSLLVFEAKEYYQKIIRNGISPLNRLESLLETKDSSAPGVGSNGREILLASEKYPVIIERRAKEFYSLIRKILVRDTWNFTGDAQFMDIYAESYIFDESAISEMQEDERTPPFLMTNGKDEKIDTYKAPLVVHNFLIELKNKLPDNESIQILQFKGLPKEGEGVVSNGVGGGAKVRFLKFYIQHTDSVGVKRMREVQMFLPKTENGKTISGEVDYKAKKDDDERYGLARLFTHGNVYSLIELLFPHHVYGEKMKEFFKVKKHDK